MFYKIKIHLKETINDIDRLTNYNGEISRQMSEERGDSFILNLTTIRKKDLQALAICNKEFDLQYDFDEVLKTFLEACALPVESVVCLKLNLYEISRSLSILDHQSERNTATKVLADSDELQVWLPHFNKDSFELKDEIVNEKHIAPKSYTLKQAFELEKKLIETKTNPNVVGNPVHYMIEAKSLNTIRDLARCMVYTLHQNKRLVQNHLVEVYFSTRRKPRFLEDFNVENYSILDVANQLAQGGALLMAIDDESFAQLAQNQIDEVIEQLAKEMLLTRHQTLYMMCTDNIESKVFLQLRDKLSKFSFVMMKESALTYEFALLQMKKNLEEAHMDPNLAEELLEKGKELYTPAEIAMSFANWYDDYLRNKVYPQYAHIKPFELAVVEKVQGQAYEQLQALIGLDNVKALVDDFIAAHQASRFYEKLGMTTPAISKHMVFTGSPGTAKTTVARLLGKIMNDNDLLSVGSFVEVTRSDLIERYVGWTARNVKKYFALAKGGILFIDEAYSLVDGREKSFGDEAIATIVSEMENARDDIMVIFAGYPKEMEAFISRNPGLKSRINFTLDFKDYTLQEMVEIAKFMTTSKGFTLSDDALKRITKLTAAAMSKADYGNARFIRNLIDSAITRHGSRLYKIGFDKVEKIEITELTEADFPVPDEDITASREAYRNTKFN